jgi:hypothetical protein
MTLDIERLIPTCDMPRTRIPGNVTTRWLATDSEDAYRKHGGHPIYDETSIEYKFNGHGYRCPEFTEVADIRMISVGCSHTMGVGLPQEALFHERFAERLRRETRRTVVNWNLGEPGAGTDAVERVLHMAVRILDPHIVLVLFPEVDRREYISPRGIHIPFFPNFALADPAIQATIAELVPIYRPGTGGSNTTLDNLAGITCEQDDELRFFRSYKSIEALLSDRCWLFGIWANDWVERHHVFKHVDMERYIGGWRPVDLARDHDHPGPATHELLFQSYWDAFELVRRPNWPIDFSARPSSSA